MINITAYQNFLTVRLWHTPLVMGLNSGFRLSLWFEHRQSKRLLTR